MTRSVLVFPLIAITAVSLWAQGNGKGRSDQPRVNPGAAHSNAPLGTPPASADRDKGISRAEDAGQGKKKGLTKVKPGKRKGQRR